jgi:hypothetical protein
MSESFSYGKALQESESATRAATRDAKSVESMSIEELQAEHARVNNATRAQLVRSELRRRGAL